MKNLKAFPFIFLLALPALAGCGGDKYVETRTEEEIIMGLGAQAMSEIGVSYSKFSADGVTPGTHRLVTEINQKVWEGDEKGIDFTVSYSLTPKEEYDVPYLSLNAEGTILTAQMMPTSAVAGNKYPQASSLGGAAYVLSASMKFKGYADGFVAPKGLTTTSSFVGQEIQKKNWNALSNIVKSGTIAEIKAKYDLTEGDEKINAGDTIYTTGRVTAVYDWSYEEIFRGVVITDGYRGLLLYAGCLQSAFYDQNKTQLIKEGDIVAAYGKVSPYNGLFEVKPELVRKVEDPEEIAKSAPVAYRTETVAALKKLKESQTGDLVKVEGLKVYDTKANIEALSPGQHWTIKLNDAADAKKVINTGVNYHIGDAQQTAIQDFLLAAKEAKSVFNFTGMVSATNSEIDLGPVRIGQKTASSCFELPQA